MPGPENNIQPMESDHDGGQLKAIFAPVAPQMDQVSARIGELLRAPDMQIDQCLKVLSERTGKMLRPALVLLSGRVFETPNQTHVDMAAMVELTHMASLLHDDVIDSAHIRRGQTSANALWGNTAAVLLGDYLLAQAFHLGTSLHLNGASAILCQTARTLCTGELKQNLQKGSSDITEQDYYGIIESKTAALFQCSCHLGAKASDAPAPHQQALAQYGRQLGLAFQIADDLLDILSTQSWTGKTLGTDLLQEKFTLPVIHWMNQNRTQNTRLIAELADSADIKQLIGLMEEAGSVDYARQKAYQHIDTALKHLDAIEASEKSAPLKTLAEFVVSRIQ